MGEESRSRAAAAVHAKRHTAGTRAREGERRCIDNKFGLEAMRYIPLFFGCATQRSLHMRKLSKQKLERAQGRSPAATPETGRERIYDTYIRVLYI